MPTHPVRVGPYTVGDGGLTFIVGPCVIETPDGKFVEIAELPGHPWFLAVQFHPEFQSKPLAPHPLFGGFVGASLANRTSRLEPNRRRESLPALSGAARSD